MSLSKELVTVGMIGMGSVGGGVVQSFSEGRFDPYGIILKTVAVKDPSKVRDIRVPDSIHLTGDASSIINDPEIDIVVEVMGGTDEARDYIFQALRNKKHVVTANKAALGEDLPELFDLAREKEVSLSFEAAVCGAIPVIGNLREYLSLQRVDSITGVLNGTTNYILSRMEDGLDFARALEEAQGLGIAEANHLLDTGGYDTRSKLAILASIASGAHIKPGDIPCRGITEVRLEDIVFAREFGQGYAIKLLASAKQHDGTWDIQVGPALISRDNPLASVRGKLNAVTIESDLSGPLTFTGFGASREPTAGAVNADIWHATEHVRYRTPDYLPHLRRKASITKPEDLLSQGYIRADLLHVSGTLTKVTAALADSGLSIESILQRGKSRNIDGQPYTTDIITLEQASQKQIEIALAKLTGSDEVHGPLLYMPIEE